MPPELQAFTDWMNAKLDELSERDEHLPDLTDDEALQLAGEWDEVIRIAAEHGFSVSRPSQDEEEEPYPVSTAAVEGWTGPTYVSSAAITFPPPTERVRRLVRAIGTGRWTNRRPERRSGRQAVRRAGGTKRRATSSSSRNDDSGGDPEPPEGPRAPSEVEPRRGDLVHVDAYLAPVLDRLDRLAALHDELAADVAWHLSDRGRP